MRSSPLLAAQDAWPDQKHLEERHAEAVAKAQASTTTERHERAIEAMRGAPLTALEVRKFGSWTAALDGELLPFRGPEVLARQIARKRATEVLRGDPLQPEEADRFRREVVRYDATIAMLTRTRPDRKPGVLARVLGWIRSR